MKGGVVPPDNESPADFQGFILFCATDFRIGSAIPVFIEMYRTSFVHF